MLVDLDACLGGTPREPTDQPRRLEHTVVRMEEGRRVAPCQRGLGVLAPLGGEAGFDERLVLLAELVSLLLVGSQAEAARRAKGVARDVGEHCELLLGPAPERGGRVAADRVCEHRIRCCTAAEREPTVSSTRPTGDLARLEQPDAEAGLREGERARAARDPPADDSHVHAAVELGARQRLGRLVEPVRDRRHDSRS